MEFGVIGEKLSHSFSVEVHSFFGDYDYKTVELSNSELPLFFAERNFKGVNITIPYKNAVIPYLDFISDVAKRLQSVNTVVNKGGKLYGYNTDYMGLKDLILKNEISVKGKKVLILGSGGTSKTANLLLTDMGAFPTTVSRKKNNDTIIYDEAYKNYYDTDIIINATPVGMFPNNYEKPIDLSKFTKLEAVIDAIYNPLNSELVLDAKERKIIADGGLYMLVAQGKYASELFTDSKIDRKTVDVAYENLKRSKENVVLVGMPSCGKTTVGECLKKEINRPFFDLDRIFVEQNGVEIKEFVEKNGIDEFRKIESEIIKEISKKTGVIIATGGGAILSPDNVRKLKANGKLFFIDRSLQNLSATSDRPLSNSYEKLKEMFEARYNLYKEVSDCQIDGNNSIEDTVKKIKDIVL